MHLRWCCDDGLCAGLRFVSLLGLIAPSPTSSSVAECSGMPYIIISLFNKLS